MAAILILRPLVVPSGSIAYFWRVLFGTNGLASEVLLICGVTLETVTQMQTSMAAVVVISAPLIILFLIFRKKVMAGVARGGTKG